MSKQQVTCKECGRSFNSSDELNRHNNEAHGSAMGSSSQSRGSGGRPNQGGSGGGSSGNYKQGGG